jgi:SMC interacting uncharacterized protein involved in chromosome segregation
MEIFFAEEILGEKVHDDTDDYLRYLAYLVQKAKEESMKGQLPHMSLGLDEEEAFWLAAKASELHEMVELQGLGAQLHEYTCLPRIESGTTCTDTSCITPLCHPLPYQIDTMYDNPGT